MRHLLSYLVFVGIPLGGLLGVLRLGQRVVAPIAVHGSYAVLPMAPSGMACQAYLLGRGDSTVMLYQSGRQVTLKLGPSADVTLRGALIGTDLALEGVIEPGTTPRHVACPAGDTIRVTARVHRDGPLKRLQATLSAPGCVECSPVSFVAARPRQYQGRRRS
jgi:hypothetical protein